MTQVLLSLLLVIPILMGIVLVLYLITHMIMAISMRLLNSKKYDITKRLVSIVIIPVSVGFFIYFSSTLNQMISHSGWSSLSIGLLAMGCFIIQIIAMIYLIGSFIASPNKTK